MRYILKLGSYNSSVAVELKWLPFIASSHMPISSQAFLTEIPYVRNSNNKEGAIFGNYELSFCFSFDSENELSWSRGKSFLAGRILRIPNLNS